MAEGADANGTGLPPPQRLGHADRAGFLIVGQFVGLACNLAGPILLTRFLTQSDYGTYRQLILISGLFIPVVTLGLPAGLLFFYPRLAPEQRPRLVQQTTMALSFLAVVAALALFLLRGRFAVWFHNPDLASLIAIFSIYLIAASQTEQVYNFFVAREQARRAGLYSATMAFLPTAGAIVGGKLSGAAGASIGLTIGGIILAGYGLSILLRYHLRIPGLDWRIDRALVREQLSYGVPLGAAAGLRNLGFYVDQVIVSVLRSPTAYAVYSVGMLQLRLTNALAIAVGTALLPWMDLLRIAGVSMLAGIPSAAVLWVMGPGVSRLVATFSVYVVAYCVLVLITRTLTARDRDLLRRWASARFLVGHRGRPVG